jgi:Sulfatase
MKILSLSILLGFLSPSVEATGVRGGKAGTRRQATAAASTDPPLTPTATPKIPNIVVILIDDLGWNQVGYHASQVGNYEIQTPNIDRYASEGIELDRGYMTPWCAPSRAALQTGRTNIYNPNITGDLYAFDESIGYAGGMPASTTTIAKAFKQAAVAAGASKPVAYYNGKYGIGGTSWANTPLGMDYDYFVGFWGDSIDSCDGHVPLTSVPPYATGPHDQKYGPLLMSVLPGYWEQSADLPDSDWCPYLQGQAGLSDEEKQVACKSQPRTPPKIIDLDLLDSVVTQIRTHDYDAGPMLQFFATQTMHTPIQYPRKYDTINNSTNATVVPSHFAQGQPKPVATADDLRIATANAVRFVDDVVGDTLQAIKDAGQWDNTIVYFTTDNGGAVYIETANNNYPLRSSKFSKLEGGVRVPQFISGGWIDKQFPPSASAAAPSRAAKSDTFVFVPDVAPTLLDMAIPGAHKYLLGDRSGAVYGNPMWTYIKNSLVVPPNPTTTSAGSAAASAAAAAAGALMPPHQLPRRVSYGPDFYFDVQANRTVKNFYTGTSPQTSPRLWSPNYPQTSDLLMDFGYVSVMPCRPGGVALECCSLNVVDDPQEFSPAMVNCTDLHVEAQQLYEIEGGCNPDGEPQTNPLCVAPGGISEGQYPDAYKLWTLYGAAGPFTSASGVPVNSSIPMKCVCEGIANGTLPSEVDYYVPAIMGPTQCFSTSKTGGTMLAQGVPCSGGFAFDPQGGMLESYQAQGYDTNLYQTLLAAEQTKKLASQRQLIVQNVRTYASRVGYTEWPSAGRFPFNAFGLDSCPAKGVTPVPWPLVNIAAYLYGSSDPTLPAAGSPLGLCVEFGSGKYYCPAKQNANLTAISAWDVTTNNTHATFVDGRVWTPMSAAQCRTKCAATPEGSAYIGKGEHGVLV